MGTPRVRSKDKRCMRTCKAIENAFICFYAENVQFKKLPVMMLCKSAKVSTPTFYRHYEGTYAVAVESYQRITEQLENHIKNEMALLINLMKLFQFIADNKIYYEVALTQMYVRPLEDVRIVLKPSILKYIKKVRKINRAEDIDDWICYEVSEYIVSQLKWWVKEEKNDAEKMDERIQEILRYARQRIEAADERLVRGDREF